ncbi:uncharacterized protein LOC130642097 isoform X2 [Hydractinia symbiolongicarpus]|uniref:uncharacterized protein LOC130642097 isoform X2 n=1 Tax=Hydractinia symbiolongicarpus TaxID=13093 RepID=UPI00254BB87A|nr:uncharacterized protein LOC130642097 isoform X2 [Hydractinia symbiolongicarpus]
MKQPRSKSETAEQLDDTDASVDYQNFENENLPGEEREREEDLEFVNPLFKQKPRLFNSTIDKIDDEDYSKLAFQNSATNTPKDSPIQTVKKKPEQIEMGVKNYGYMNENSSRPASWDSTLSAFNPYAIDTPIGEPVNARHPSVGMEMSESPPTHRQNSITKKSDYSSISDVNPYMTPTEKSPQYEDLAGIRNNHTNNKQIIPSSSKKMNMIYEPAVISRHSETYRKKTSVSEEGSYSDNSSYCHLMFTILIGILAIVALLIAFLVVFGVVSAKKCKECDVTTVSTGAATGGIDQKELDLQLAYIKGNLTLLQNVLHANSSVTIATLQRDLDAQKSLVASLTTQLNKQKQLTASLNQHINNFTVIKESLRGRQGFQGPPGAEGPQGRRGPAALGGEFKDCFYRPFPEQNNVTGINIDKATTISSVTVQKTEIAIGAYCSSNVGLHRQLNFDTVTYRCTCSGVRSSSVKFLDCTTHVFMCNVP